MVLLLEYRAGRLYASLNSLYAFENRLGESRVHATCISGGTNGSSLFLAVPELFGLWEYKQGYSNVPLILFFFFCFSENKASIWHLVLREPAHLCLISPCLISPCITFAEFVSSKWPAKSLQRACKGLPKSFQRAILENNALGTLGTQASHA